jgi:hypothetical protein
MFERFHEENAKSAAESIRTRVGAMREDMRLALARWFTNEESLNALCANHWNESLVNTGRSLFDDVRFQLKRAADNETAGLHLHPDVLADMKAAGFSAGPCGGAALSGVSPSFDSAPFPAHLSAGVIPVKKTWVDWLLFRSIDKVRERLFGVDGGREIPIEEKEKRFLPISKEAFEKELDRIVQERFPSASEKFAAEIGKEYAEGAVREVVRRLRELRSNLSRERADLQAPFDVDSAVLAASLALEKSADDVASDIAAIALQEGISFGETGDELVPILVPAEQSQVEIGFIPELPLLLPG